MTIEVMTLELTQVTFNWIRYVCYSVCWLCTIARRSDSLDFNMLSIVNHLSGQHANL